MKKLVIIMALIMFSSNVKAAGEFDIIAGSLFIFNGFAFTALANSRDAKINSQRDQQDFFQRSTNWMYQKSGVEFGKADTEKAQNGETQAYQDFLNNGLVISQQAGIQQGYTNGLSGSVFNEETLQKQYETIAIASYAVGGVLLIKGIVTKVIHSKKAKVVLQSIDIKATPDQAGGMFVLRKRI